MNYFTNDKHYNTLNEYYKAKFHKKVTKIALNASFTCPNKDGKKGYGGCSYCTPLGSGDYAGNINHPLDMQFLEIKAIMNKKWPDCLYIPYFQANSNTYASVEKLKETYEPVLALDPNIIGIAIATRADCLPDDVIEYLSELNTRYPVQIELGLQTSNEETGKRINRLSTNEEFINSVNKLRKNNIEVVVHIINGLPNETEKDMLNTIDFINKLDIQGIKIHSLLLLDNTKMYQEYLENPFHILTLEEYVDITVKQITRLKDSIIIHRLAADGVITNLVEPKWSIRKLVVMNEIDKKMRRLNLYQGMTSI